MTISYQSNKRMNSSRNPASTTSKGLKTPKETDVVFGRGKPFIQHKGNRVLHALGDKYRSLYKSFNCKTTGTVQRKRKYGYGSKREIVNAIIMELHGQGARFLKQDTKNDLWVEVDDEEARQKVSHLLRSKPATEPLPDDMSSNGNSMVQESPAKRIKSHASLGSQETSIATSATRGNASEQAVGNAPQKPATVSESAIDLPASPLARTSVFSTMPSTLPWSGPFPPQNLPSMLDSNQLLLPALSPATQLQAGRLGAHVRANATTFRRDPFLQDRDEFLLWLAMSSRRGLFPP